eukprot:3902_1
MVQVKMFRQYIADKHAFWNQLGFEIKNEHKEIILIIAKHSSLSHNCVCVENDKEINNTILQRLVTELQLDEVLKQISNTTKIDCLMTQLTNYQHSITDKDLFWNQLGFEITNQ